LKISRTSSGEISGSCIKTDQSGSAVWAEATWGPFQAEMHKTKMKEEANEERNDMLTILAVLMSTIYTMVLNHAAIPTQSGGQGVRMAGFSS